MSDDEGFSGYTRSESDAGPVRDEIKFTKRLHRRIFENEDNIVIDAGSPKLDTEALKNLSGVEFLDATVGPVLLMGLRQLVKIRPRKPREWLAFYLLSKKPHTQRETDVDENADQETEEKDVAAQTQESGPRKPRK